MNRFEPSRTYSPPSRRAVVRIAAESEPDPDSVSAYAASHSPDASRGSHRSFCSSEPASLSPSEPSSCTASSSAEVAQTFATSSIATSESSAPVPSPPNSSPKNNPKMSFSRYSSTTSQGNSCDASISAARGAIRSRASVRTRSRSSRCSSFSTSQAISRRDRMRCGRLRSRGSAPAGGGWTPARSCAPRRRASRRRQQRPRRAQREARAGRGRRRRRPHCRAASDRFGIEADLGAAGDHAARCLGHGLALRVAGLRPREGREGCERCTADASRTSSTARSPQFERSGCAQNADRVVAIEGEGRSSSYSGTSALAPDHEEALRCGQDKR